MSLCNIVRIFDLFGILLIFHLVLQKIMYDILNMVFVRNGSVSIQYLFFFLIQNVDVILLIKNCI